MRFFRIILLLLLTILMVEAHCQKTEADSAVSIPMFYGFYGYQWPGGGMKAQFGSNSTVGAGFMLKTSSNWIYGAEYNFLFGSKVKIGSEILKGITNSDGYIINGDGTPAVINLFERGYTVGAKFGKLIPVSSKDKNSGIFFTAGIGYISHKIRIEVQNQSAPQLYGDYKRGYDRFSGGLMICQSLGYMFFGKSNLLNFTISVEAFEGWAKAYRDYDFDKMAPPPGGSQFDFLIGPKIAWMVPLRQRNLNKYYYY